MSKIEWTDATWNPLTGCSPVSEGCRNCYAAREAAGRLSGHPAYSGLAEYRGTGDARHPVFTGEIRLHPDRLDQPLRWRKPRRVFVNSMSDLFHPDVPEEFIDRVFAVMALSPDHTFQVLTKRPERMAAYVGRDLRHPFVEAAATRVLRDVGRDPGDMIEEHPWMSTHSPWSLTWPLPNVWLGTSVEDQDAADERIPHLLRTPAAVRFLSCEPLIGPVEIPRRPESCWDHKWAGPGNVCPNCKDGPVEHPIGWVIVGGESGPGARPFDVAWARSLIRQCRAAGVACFVKQLGARPFESHVTVGGDRRWADLSDRKGGDPEEWPEELRVREWPEPAEVGADAS